MPWSRPTGIDLFVNYRVHGVRDCSRPPMVYNIYAKYGRPASAAAGFDIQIYGRPSSIYTSATPPGPGSAPVIHIHYLLTDQ